MAPKPRIYNLPDNLSFDKNKQKYRYRNPITNKWIWFGRDRDMAINKAKQVNRIIELQRSKTRAMNSEPATVGTVVDCYLKIEFPEKPWKPNTQKNNLAKINVIKKELGHLSIATVDRIYLADWLRARATNGDTYMKWRAMLVDLWTFAYTQKWITINEPAVTPKRTTSKKIEANRKIRKRLDPKGFWLIHKNAPPWLQIAMELSLITLQSRAEIVNMKFTDLRDGWLYVIRDKVSSDSDMAFISINVSSYLQDIIGKARTDNVASPYIVRFKPQSRQRAHLDSKPHWTYVNPGYLTKAFKKVRDSFSEYANLEPRQRPTFHEIRSLGARTYRELGFPKNYIKYLMTHSDQRTTNIYLENPDQLTDGHFKKVKAELNPRDMPLDLGERGIALKAELDPSMMPGFPDDEN